MRSQPRRSASRTRRASAVGVALLAGLWGGAYAGDAPKRTRMALEEAVRTSKQRFDEAPQEESRRTALARAHGELGASLLRTQDAGEARRHLVLACELAPKRPGWHYLLAVAAYYTDRPLLARSEADAALDLDPTNAAAWELRGRLRYEAGQLDDARTALTRAASRRPGAKALLAKLVREMAIERDLSMLWTAHFQVRYPPGAGNAAQASRIGEILEAAYNRVGNTLAIYPRGTVPVLVYPAGDFRGLTGAESWVAALYDGKIRLPQTKQLMGNPARLREVCTHEYVHAAIASRTRACPAWLHEGLAQAISGAKLESAALRAWARSGRLPAFQKLGRSLGAAGDEGAVRRAYAASHGFARFLLALRGPAEVAAVIDELGRGRSLDVALKGSYGEPLAPLLLRWKATLLDGPAPTAPAARQPK